MDLKIIEKPLFFLGFFDVLKKSVESFRNALGKPLGTPWGTFGTPWEALGAPWGHLGETLGTPWGTFWENLGKTLEEPAGKTSQKVHKASRGGRPCEASTTNYLLDN